MQERFLRPAPKTLDPVSGVSSVESQASRTITEHFLSHFKEREGSLWTIKEMIEIHHDFSSRAASPRKIWDIIKTLREEYLSAEENILTISSGSEMTWGVVYLAEPNRLTVSEMGAAIFKDDPEGKRVIPGLTVLSKKTAEQNPWVTSSSVRKLFDELIEKREPKRRSPLLSPRQRKLVATLLEHPEGASLRELLRTIQEDAREREFELKYEVDQSNLKLVTGHIARLNVKIGDDFWIYRLPIDSKSENKPEDSRYLLMDKRKEGERISFPVFKEDVFETIPEGPREAVFKAGNTLIAKNETRLRCLLNERERSLLIYLAQKEGIPCEFTELIINIFPGTLYPLRYRGALRSLKKSVQRVLKEETNYRIFTLRSCFDKALGIELARPIGAYVFQHKDYFQGDKPVISFIPDWEFSDIENKAILKMVKYLSSRVRVRGLDLWPEVSPTERNILIKLAERFPQGCRQKELVDKFFSRLDYPAKALVHTIWSLRNIFERELGEDILIVYGSGKYRLEVKED